MENFILYHFDIFLILVVGIMGISLLSISLLAKIFNAPTSGIKNSSSVLFLTAITFLFFYEFFNAVFNIFGAKNNIFPYILSILVSFAIFKYVFQSKYSFHNRPWDIMKIFLLFLTTDAIFLLFSYLILKTTKLI